MSKDDRLSTAYDNLSRISQYENAYSQIVYQVNQSFQNGLVSNSDQVEAFKILTGIYSCSVEEEKILLNTIKILEDDIASTRQKEESTKASSSKKGTNVSAFESIFSSQNIVVGSEAVAFVNNNWIITKVLHKENNTYGVIDLYPDTGSTPEESFVNENQILFYIGLHPDFVLSTENYILPYGKRVLALWPESTTFYPAIVKGRTGIDDKQIAIQFDDVNEQTILPYHYVIPYKKTT